MAKFTAQDLQSGFDSVNSLNANFSQLETLSDTWLSLDGTTPNSMSAQLDMNGNRIINLPSPGSDNDPARWIDVKDGVTGIAEPIPDQTGNNGKVLGTTGSALIFKDVQETFATISDLDAAATIHIGSFVSVVDYATGNDSGVLFFEIVAAATGTADGGSFIDLTTSGLQAKQIFNEYVSVKQFGATGDGTTDDQPAIQAAIDYAGPNRFSVFFPPGSYLIDLPIDLGVTDTPGLGSSLAASIFGPPDSHNGATIITAPNFGSDAEYSMVRNWKDAWYVGAESRDGPPDDMLLFDDMFSRYPNIRHLRFQINGTQTKDITCIDLIGTQERSHIEGITVAGDTASKGWPLRIDSAAVSFGNETSINGVMIKGWTTLSNNWIGEAKIRGGSDGDIDGWVTATEDFHGTELFDLAITDMTIRNLHCEGFVATGPIIKSDGRGCSLHQSFFTVRNGQGASTSLIEATNDGNPGGGFGRTGFTINTLYLLPDPTTVPNAATINVLDDDSQRTGVSKRTIAYRRDGSNDIATLFQADRAGYSYATGQNNEDINEEFVFYSQARMTGALTLGKSEASSNTTVPLVTNRSTIYLGNYTAPQTITDFDGEDDDQILFVINDDTNDHTIAHDTAKIRTIGGISHRLRVGGMMQFHKVAGQTYWIMVSKGTSDQQHTYQNTTTANLANIASGVNTVGKFDGVMVKNTDTNKIVFADGSAAGDVWRDAQSVVLHTPI
jgi:hypothetical protein